VVLALSERVLGLQKQVFAFHQALGDRCRDRPSHRRLVVMASLIGGVDASESARDRQLGQMLRLFFLPSRSVEERWNFHSSDR
jgi:hypothetical protein